MPFWAKLERVSSVLQESAALLTTQGLDPARFTTLLVTGSIEPGEADMAAAQGVDALYALAATAEIVPAHLFEAVHNAVIADEDVFARMIACNPGGAAAIADRLQDALARGMWTARRNAVAQELSQATARRAGRRPSFTRAAE